MYIESGIKVTVGQATEKGAKAQNEDAIGCLIPNEPLLSSKGLVSIIADGVSSAEAGKEASETCVKNFLSDYFSTPDSWTVKSSAQRILSALNRWLYGQGLRYLAAERGYISTLSALVIKSRVAHIFHIGDTRVYRLRNGDLEQLTHDHAVAVSQSSSYLSRAMGMDLMLDVDYYSSDVEKGDVFFLSTDGVHDFIGRACLRDSLKACQGDSDLEQCCKALIHEALQNGSDDNLSCQLLRVDELPQPNAEDASIKLSELPFPPSLSPGMCIDGFRVEEELHASTRSQVYRVVDIGSGETWAMKTPSLNFEDDLAFKERFVMEPWIGRRIESEHVVGVPSLDRKQSFLYYLCEHVEGVTLTQWMHDHPRPSIDRALNIIKQVVKGLRAMHRQETLHQDIKPDNIIVGKDDHVTLLDFGSCHIAGFDEVKVGFVRDRVLGTDTYGAPEYKLGKKAGTAADMFSVAMVLYEMLTGELPYGESFEECMAGNDFYRLKYREAGLYNPMVPDWMDGAIRRALHISPELRYEALSEFVYDLEHPNALYMNKSFVPLSKRNPLLFWKSATGVLVALNLLTLWLWLG